jgi:hypothetical protein
VKDIRERIEVDHRGPGIRQKGFNRFDLQDLESMMIAKISTVMLM